jgi:hypothetical protein
MNRLEYLITKALHAHRGARSKSTLRRQEAEGKQMARQLYGAGYKLTALSQIRGKSVDCLTDIWKGDRADPTTGRVRQLAAGTQAIRLTTLRLICHFAGKEGLVPKSNKRAGLVPRERVPAANIAWKLSNTDLAKVRSPEVRLVLRLQAAFALRKEEACLLDARIADRGNVLQLTRGTKGRRPRSIPIVSDEQRALLREVKIFNDSTPRGTLVTGASLKQSYSTYKNDMAAAGLTHGHGLRHRYAQERHFALTQERDKEKHEGWLSPKAGGPATDKLSEDNRIIDNAVRELLAEELGHTRTRVCAIYIG